MNPKGHLLKPCRPFAADAAVLDHVQSTLARASLSRVRQSCDKSRGCHPCWYEPSVLSLTARLLRPCPRPRPGPADSMGIHHSFARGRNNTRSGVCLVDKDTRVEPLHFFLFDGSIAGCNEAGRHSECRSSSFGPQPPSFGLLRLWLFTRTRRQLFSLLAPGHVTSLLLATFFRFLRQRPVLLRHTLQLLFQPPRRTPCCRPRTPGHMHSEGSIICRASRRLIWRAFHRQ